MSDELKIKKSNKFTMFVPAFIDDYGFTPEEFRVFSRIMRRSLGANSEGCIESIPNMAASLQIGEGLVRRSLNVLLGCGAISRTGRSGKSDVFEFNGCESWMPSEKLPEIRGAVEMKTKERDAARRAKKKPTGYGTATTTRIGTITTLVTEPSDEGIPLKDIPSKVIPFSTKTGDKSPPIEKDLPPKAEEQRIATTIWDAGLWLLLSQGANEDNSRSFLARMIGQVGKEHLAGVIAKVSVMNPPPPSYRSYIAGACRPVEVKRNPTQREMQALDRALEMELATQTSATVH